MKYREQNLTQAGAILLLSAIVVKLIGALFKIPLSADYALGDIGFGYFSAVYDLFIPISTLALSGFPVAIARMITDYNAREEEEKVHKILTLSFKALTLLGIAGMLVFCLLAVISGNNYTFSFLAVAPSVLFCCIASVYRGYYEGQKNMVPTAVSNIIEALGKLVLGLTGAVAVVSLTKNPALGSAAALLGITIGTLLSCMYLMVRLKKTYKVNYNVKSFDRELVSAFSAILIPIAVASLSVGITAFIDSITIKPQLTSIIAENSKNVKLLLKGTVYDNIEAAEIPTVLYGIKGKAHTLFNLVPTLTTALGVGVVPIVTQFFQKNDRQNLRKNIDLCFKYSAVLSAPVAVGFISVGEGIMKLLYGDNSYVLGGKILWIYGFAALFAGLSVPTTALLQSVSRQKNALINIIIGIAVKLICNLILVPCPQINIFGAAIGTALCFFVIFILNMFSLDRLKLTPNAFNSLLKPLIAAVCCGVTAKLVYNAFNSPLGTVICIATGGIIYLLVLLVFGTISKADLKELLKNK